MSLNNKFQQIPLDFPGRSAQGRDDFLIGQCNQAAVSWIDLWPEWPAPLLVINGPAACGKTHLSAVWKERAKAVFVNSDLLLTHSAEDIAAQGACLILDGIDLFLGEEVAETTLFHLYNIFKEEGRTFLTTMRMAPSHLDFIIPDLASRFRAAPVATIEAPDDMLLGSVLIKLFSDRQLIVSNDVIKYILPRMERSFFAARLIVNKADATALSQKRGISVPLMREVLSSIIREN